MTSERIALSIKETCDLIGVSRAHLYAEWARGRGPNRIKVGRRTLIQYAALQEWLNSAEVNHDQR
jgi:excisionase family DNA binding protein